MGAERIRATLLIVALLVAIIGPFLVFGPAIEGWVDTHVSTADPSWSLAALLIGLLASDLLLPVPSSLVAVAAGVAFGGVVGAVVIGVGMSLGAWLGYELGLRGGARAVQRWVSGDGQRRLAQLGQTHGVWLLLSLRAVPVLAEASVVVAGAARLPCARVLAVTSLANGIIAIVYAAVGGWAATSGNLEVAAMAGVAIPGAAMGVARLTQRRADHRPGAGTH